MAGTVRDLFEASLVAEAEGRKFYQLLSTALRDHPAVAQLWHDLMLDESRHIAAIQELRRGLTDLQLAEPVGKAYLVRACAIRDVLTAERLDGVRTLDDAYELAHEFEKSEVNRLFLFLANRYIPEASRRKLITMELTEHQRRLSWFTQPFGDRAWRRSVPIVWAAVQEAGARDDRAA